MVFTVQNATYTYPSGYGLGSCQKFDLKLPPYCLDFDDEFCELEWCYVDTKNCGVTNNPSPYHEIVGKLNL